MQYEIKGTPFPVAICTLNQGESLITERGSMSWMSTGLDMQTKGGSVGKAFGRLLSGEQCVAFGVLRGGAEREACGHHADLPPRSHT